jgi:acetyl esterase/lipase
VNDSVEKAGIVIHSGKPALVGGKPWTYVANVSRPTITVYAPRGRNTGAAVLVFPGGGYEVLAIDLEGTEACDWATSKGMTCVLLKYRVPCAVSGPHRECLTALQDAQRAISLVRFNANKWHIDPHKIGVLGFSAGGHMVVTTTTEFPRRAYRAVDAVDALSCRPDFGIALYPGHLSTHAQPTLNSHVHVTSSTPPTMLVQAKDDPVDPVENSLVYFAALQKAGVPAELHIFVHGGHAFGLRPTDQPITHWPALAESWLASIGMIAR